jgi:hypothetical protein
MSDFPSPNPLSRRTFLQTATAALAASQVAENHTEQAGLPPATVDVKSRRISENLYVLENTCNVYLIRDGGHGLLIDFGSGLMLRHLAALGVSTMNGAQLPRM